jgi:hypothetical protein
MRAMPLRICTTVLSFMVKVESAITGAALTDIAASAVRLKVLGLVIVASPL